MTIPQARRSRARRNREDEFTASQWFRRPEPLISFLMLLFAVAFNLYHLYPEVAVRVPDMNDSVLHLLATDLAVGAIAGGRNAVDPWLSTIGMGFPLFHYYQHLPYVSTALVHVITLGAFPLVGMVNWTAYLLLSLFPLSIYWSMRRFDFDQLSSAMGGLVASLTATDGLYGLGFMSYVWRGYGLYTQLWGMVLLPPALALGYRVLREGKGYFWATLLLAATLMSHLIYGYIAFLSLGVLTLLPATRLLTPKSLGYAMWKRWKRLLILLLLVAVVTSYFLLPSFLDRTYSYLGPSVWEPPEKLNSYGHSWVLHTLATGDLFDFNRFPSLTILMVVGFVICLWRWREERYLVPLAVFMFWLLLYFGRPTWGVLLDLLPLSRDLPLHRLIAGVQLGGIFMMAIALAAPWRWAVSRAGVQYLVAPLALTALLLFPVYGERASYLTLNARLMRESQQAMAAEDQDLSALFEKLNQLPPGRVYAGQRNNWGWDYIVGCCIPVYALLNAEGRDNLGFYPHAHSLNSEGLVLFDENRREHYNLYNVRYVVAPQGRAFPEFVRPLQDFGRHRLYRVETTGYFDLVGADQAFAGDRTGFFQGVSSWLASDLPSVKQHPVVIIGGSGRIKGGPEPLPLAQAGDLIPKLEVPTSPHRGEVFAEAVGDNFFAADVTVERESLLLLKATYHPNWRATIDGVETDIVMLMPSFIGIQLSPGDHQVRFEYRPRRLRMILLVLGLFTLPMIAVGEKRGKAFSDWFALKVLVRASGSMKRRVR